MGNVVKIDSKKDEFKGALVEALLFFKTLDSFAEAGYDCKTKKEVKDLISSFIKFRDESYMSKDFLFLTDAVLIQLTCMKGSIIGNAEEVKNGN